MSLGWNQFDGYDLTEPHISVGSGVKVDSSSGNGFLGVQFIL